MTTLQEALPCPFCGKQHTLQVISGQELMGEDQEFWQHSESFGVVCDASTPDGKGGCGAMGGFKPTEDEAIEAWNTRTALAQQGDQQPVCAGCGIPAGDVHMSTCQSGKWPSRVSNGDTAAPASQAQEPCPNGSKCKHGAWCTEVYCQELCEFRNQPAPQPAQDVPEVGFGNMPYSPYLFGGLRFKMNFDKSGNATNFHGVESALQGAWVALVDATDNCHLQSAQPVAQYDKTEMNAFVTDLYQRKSTDGQHGFYETLFHVVHKAIARVGIREVK